MIRILLIIVFLAGTAGAVVAYGDPDKIARAGDSLSHMIRQKSLSPPPAVQIPRGQGGEFSLKAKINGVSAPMVIDTGATSVVLTWETAKAIGVPVEMLEYNVDLETAGGHAKAARLTLDRLSVGKLDGEISTGAGGAARAHENQSARHELSRPAGKLGRALRPADAARLSRALKPQVRPAAARQPWRPRRAARRRRPLP